MIVLEVTGGSIIVVAPRRGKEEKLCDVRCSLWCYRIRRCGLVWLNSTSVSRISGRHLPRRRRQAHNRHRHQRIRSGKTFPTREWRENEAMTQKRQREPVIACVRIVRLSEDTRRGVCGILPCSKFEDEMWVRNRYIIVAIQNLTLH